MNRVSSIKGASRTTYITTELLARGTIYLINPSNHCELSFLNIILQGNYIALKELKYNLALDYN